MSIDRIGKGPSGPSGVAPTGASSVEPGARTGAAFEVNKTEAADAATQVSPASRVRAGEMSLDAYLDQRVVEATRHLDGKLPASDLADIQTMLRSQLANDPTLVEMVRAATGAAPPAQDE